MKQFKTAIKHLSDYKMKLLEEAMFPDGIIDDYDQRELDEIDEAINTLKVLNGAKTPVSHDLDLDRVDHEFALAVGK
jgi:hypothetical protein